jgi:cyclopropane fatty-acyl-phospholipid synthase-like methyltransferase
MEINSRGFWENETEEGHYNDKFILEGINEIITENNIKSLVDFGCGPGYYVYNLRNKLDYFEAYDGNPNTPIITGGVGKVVDLSENMDLGRTFDFVLSLEVGEHIPKQYETIFIDNLLNHSNKVIILSWATIGQGGYGHVNEQPNNYIESLFTPHGYTRNLEYEKRLRDSAHWWWFKNTIIFFEKK